MSDWNLSLVAIVPISLQDEANRLACALDYDFLPGNTFSVPLSATGSEPITHYACRSAAKQEFLNILASASQGILPDIDWTQFGINVEDIPTLLASLYINSVPAEEADGHFNSVLQDQGLQRIVEQSI